jgi:hypothetical protein
MHPNYHDHECSYVYLLQLDLFSDTFTFTLTVPPICIHKDSADLVGLAEAYNPSENCSRSSGASSHNQWAGAAFRLAEIAYLVHRYILFISSITVDGGGRTSSKRP